MNKKIIILNIKRHHGEIDWILPLLFRFDKSYTLITIFDFVETYKNFKKNKFLYNLWNKRNNYVYLKKKRNKLFFKVLFEILKIIQIFFKVHLIRFEGYLLDNIMDFEFFLKKYKKNYENIKAFFIANHNKSYLPNFIKKKNPRCKIIRFPESPWIFPTGNQNKNYIKKAVFKKNTGDSFLHTCKSNSDFFLGTSKKVTYCKNFRYEKWWLKKFKKKRVNKKKFTILVATRPVDNDYLPFLSYEKIIYMIMSASNQISNSKVIFKIHPHAKEKMYLKNLLEKLEYKNWELNSNHAFVLANQADICISMLTSTCLDFLSLKKPTVEVFIPYVGKRKASKEYPHLVFYKKNKKWISIFEYLGFLKSYNTKEDLIKLFKKVKLRNSPKYWNKYFIKFDKWEKNKIGSRTYMYRLQKLIN